MTTLSDARGAGAAAATVVAALAAVALTGSLAPTPARVDNSPVEVPTSRAQLSCPETATGTGNFTDLLAVAPPIGSDDPGGGRGEGTLTVRALSSTAAEEQPVAETDQVGTPVATRLGSAAAPSVTVDAVGGLAPAAYAAQRTVLGAGQDVGLSVAACSPAGDVWWFAGADTAVGATSRLVLSNPTPAVAVVDLTFYGPKGIVKAVGARGIPVAPRSRQSLDLAKFAPGLDAVTLRVKATRGRVAAAVNVARVNGVTPAGNEWLASSEPPATDILVNAGDSGDGEQRLVITNPSGREALVQVRVLDVNGPFTPDSLTDLRIRPGRTLVKDISADTETSAAALQVTTDQAQSIVLATLLSENPSTPVDLSSSSSSKILDGPAVIPAFPGTQLSLAFASAQPGGGAVRVQAYGDDGEPVGEPKRLAVKAKTTKTLDVGVAPGVDYLVASVDDGSRLQGVATYHGRTGVSALPIVSTPTTVTRPAVRPAG